MPMVRVSNGGTSIPNAYIQVISVSFWACFGVQNRTVISSMSATGNSITLGNIKATATGNGTVASPTVFTFTALAAGTYKVQMQKYKASPMTYLDGVDTEVTVGANQEIFSYKIFDVQYGYDSNCMVWQK